MNSHIKVENERKCERKYQLFCQFPRVVTVAILRKHDVSSHKSEFAFFVREMRSFLQLTPMQCKSIQIYEHFPLLSKVSFGKLLLLLLDPNSKI
jgi:hypothetical protein